MNNNIYILDCTLRDGGYINDWEFGEKRIISIIHKLEDAKIDMIEVGFLRGEQSLLRLLMNGIRR